MTVEIVQQYYAAYPADAGLPPAHGQRYVLPGGAFFEVRAGRIARITNFYNLEAWLEQVR